MVKVKHQESTKTQIFPTQPGQSDAKTTFRLSLAGSTSSAPAKYEKTARHIKSTIASSAACQLHPLFVCDVS